jgi:hypothetical protein
MEDLKEGSWSCRSCRAYFPPKSFKAWRNHVCLARPIESTDVRETLTFESSPLDESASDDDEAAPPDFQMQFASLASHYGLSQKALDGILGLIHDPSFSPSQVRLACLWND